MIKDINKLAKQLKKELDEDILSRYGNAEYYDPDIADRFYHKLKENEIQKITEILGV